VIYYSFNAFFHSFIHYFLPSSDEEATLKARLDFEEAQAAAAAAQQQQQPTEGTENKEAASISVVSPEGATTGADDGTAATAEEGVVTSVPEAPPKIMVCFICTSPTSHAYFNCRKS
jgi:hypothetical protein